MFNDNNFIVDEYENYSNCDKTEIIDNSNENLKNDHADGDMALANDDDFMVEELDNCDNAEDENALFNGNSFIVDEYENNSNRDETEIIDNCDDSIGIFISYFKL